MGKQRIDIKCNDYEKNILNLEKKYFEIIYNIISHEDFFKDLALIEKEISDNYSKFDGLWNLKNKIKIPAERVVRHHLYVKMVERIKGIFPSPLSSDFGIKFQIPISTSLLRTNQRMNIFIRFNALFFLGFGKRW